MSKYDDMPKVCHKNLNENIYVDDSEMDVKSLSSSESTVSYRVKVV